jgi:hypothetical protein
MKPTIRVTWQSLVGVCVIGLSAFVPRLNAQQIIGGVSMGRANEAGNLIPVWMVTAITHVGDNRDDVKITHCTRGNAPTGYTHSLTAGHNVYYVGELLDEDNQPLPGQAGAPQDATAKIDDYFNTNPGQNGNSDSTSDANPGPSAGSPFVPDFTIATGYFADPNILASGTDLGTTGWTRPGSTTPPASTDIPWNSPVDPKAKRHAKPRSPSQSPGSNSDDVPWTRPGQASPTPTNTPGAGGPTTPAPSPNTPPAQKPTNPYVAPPQSPPQAPSNGSGPNAPGGASSEPPSPVATPAPGKPFDLGGKNNNVQMGPWNKKFHEAMQKVHNRLKTDLYGGKLLDEYRWSGVRYMIGFTVNADGSITPLDDNNNPPPASWSNDPHLPDLKNVHFVNGVAYANSPEINAKLNINGGNFPSGFEENAWSYVRQAFQPNADPNQDLGLPNGLKTYTPYPTGLMGNENRTNPNVHGVTVPLDQQ